MDPMAMAMAEGGAGGEASITLTTDQLTKFVADIIGAMKSPRKTTEGAQAPPAAEGAPAPAEAAPAI
jgi:hypothetical protein